MSFDFATKAKKLTHGIAVAGAALVGWALSPQGQQVIGGVVKAYPKASVITGVLAFLGTLYYKS